MENAQAIDAAAWTCMPRRRTFLCTLLPADLRRLPQRRPPPWDRGWGLANGGRAPAMLRARNRPGEPIRASTYQYGPGMLLYQRGTGWQDAPLATCAARIRALLPVELRAGWTLVERGLANGCREHEALPTVSWIAAHGTRHGCRIPNVAERARGMGMGAYLHSLGQLGLDELQMFNAQGNSFDRAAVALKLRDGVARWLAGGDFTRHC